METNGCEQIFSETALFASLPAGALGTIARQSSRMTFVKGEVLFEVGAPGDSAYVVESGVLRVLDSNEPDARVLREITRGECVGEMAVLTSERRSACVVAAMNTVAYSVPGEILRSTFRDHPEAYARLSQRLMQTLQQKSRSADPGFRVVGLIGTASAPARTMALAQALAEMEGADVAIADFSASSERFRTIGERVTIVSAPDPGAQDSAEFIAELHRSFRRVLASVTTPSAASARRALAQCDVVYWDGAAESELETTSRALAALVRQAPPFRMWRGGRRISSVAREVLGRRRALVLGAGGVKGFAHVGALRAFERHGIEFDAVAGTSIGAYVGALLAQGRSADDIAAVLFEVAGGCWADLLGPSADADPSARSRRKTELLHHHLGDTKIEELALPFFTVAGDLASLSQVVLRSGSLAVALDATSSIPMIFDPVRVDGRLLVDGWICNPLPADVVRKEGYEEIVAIDLCSAGRDSKGECVKRERDVQAQLGALPTAMRVIEIASREHVLRSLPFVDHHIRPELEEFSNHSVRSIPEIFERGERAAEKVIGKISGDAWRS
jgi:NTE family protein